MAAKPWHTDDGVALGAVACWALGAALGGVYGLWLGLGLTAILVGATVLVLQTRAHGNRLFRFRAVDIAAGILTGLLMVWVTRALYMPVVKWLPLVNVDAATLYAALGDRPLRVYGLLILPIALGEEIVWRGSVQGALERRLGAVGAVLVAAVLYAVVHAPVGVPSLCLIALACGLGWGMLRALTGGLVASFLAHVVWDEIMFFVAPLVAP